MSSTDFSTTERGRACLLSSMPKRKATGAAGKPAADTRPINQRGQTWQAVKLTGNRAQRGNLPDGAPRFVYKVLWQGGAKTYEPVPRVPGNLCDCRASLLPSWHLLLTETPECSSISHRCRHHLHKDQCSMTICGCAVRVLEKIN